MSVYTNVLDAVIGMAGSINLYAPVVVGALPPDNGISMTFSGGSPPSTFWNKGTIQAISVVLNGKHTNQKKVADVLSDIHASLTRRNEYPNTDDFQIMDIATISAPNLIGREQNDQWLYGSSLRITFFWR